MFLSFAIIGIAYALPSGASENYAGLYACTVKAGSHTARYTFSIKTSPCSVYWREIDSDLKIRDCQPPIIAALKPSARDNLSVVWFNLESGAFYDYLSGVKDRGICNRIIEPVQ